VINNDDQESLVNDNSPVIVRADDYGNGSERVVITRLEVADGSYKLQSAFIPRFNKKGSVYPLSLIGQFAAGSFDNTGFISFLRFGEKQSFDTFLNCTKNLSDIFPLSFLNILPRGTEIRVNGVNFRRFYYHIIPYLNSLPSIYFGNDSNTGGSTEGFQLDGKSSYQIPKIGSEAVFSLSEGVGITSGFYRNNLSGVFEVEGIAIDVWLDERMKNTSIFWIDKLEVIKHDSINPGGTPEFMTRIWNSVVGWLSFWIDASGYDTTTQSNYQIYIFENDITNGAQAQLQIISDKLEAWTGLVTKVVLYDGVDWRKPHRITIRWNHIDQSDYELTVQLDDLEPKSFNYPSGLGAALNGFSANTLQILSAAGTNIKYWGFTQSGDYFPFVYAESNKGYFLPFNINLMDGITSVTGPNRRDDEGFKNLYSTDGTKTFISGKEPLLSYPEGEFLNLQFMQKGIEVGDNPWVRFLDGSNDGFELKLEWNALERSIDDHLLDEIDAGVQQNILNYRLSQWIANDWANWWLPTMVSMQTHPKYPTIFIYNGWYNRYIYGGSELSGLITQIESILTGDPTHENIADLEYTPLTHPFCYPNNIGFYFGNALAMPEKFDKSPQRMRKPFDMVEEGFGDFKDGDNISAATSPYWVFGGVANTEFIASYFEGGMRGRLIDNNVALSSLATFTFPIPSPSTPGFYEVSFDIYIEDNGSKWAICELREGGVNRVVVQFNEATMQIQFNGNAVQAWTAATWYHVIIHQVDATQGAITVNGNYYDNGGAYYANSGGNFAGAIAEFRIEGHSIRTPSYYIDNINAHWEVYPNIDNDDFIIYPSYLGHARPIEVVGLNDQWGFRDYGKYTATPNTHPTKFWVSFFVSASYGSDESNGEIIFYDVSGSEMFYLQVKPLRSANLANPSKTLTYASDSAETTTALTLMDRSWVGWLPLTIEIDADNSKANIYMHCQLVAGDIDLNGSLEGFGWVSFLNGLLTLPAGSNSIWREEDFQSFGEGAAINGGAQWTVVAGGTTTFTATIINGDVWGRFLDGDNTATLSGVYTFATPSPATPSGANQYSIKWEKNITSLTNNGLNIRVYDTVPANGEIDMQIRAGGALWNDAGAGFVNTGYTITTVQDIELIVQFISANTFNIYEDGDLVNTGGVLTVKTAWTGTVDILEFRTLANADDCDILFDNIDASWTENVPEGSLLIDAIQWSCLDDDGKEFKDRKRCDFILPYREYINPHLSTFYNNLNGPTNDDVTPLPPSNAQPNAAYDPGDWSSNYWLYDDQNLGGGQFRHYGGIIYNWYLWRFPYCFGGDFTMTGLASDAITMSRLRHTVSDADKETSGVWEFVWGGVIDYVAGTAGGELIATFDWNPSIGAWIPVDTLQPTNYMIRLVKRDGSDIVEVKIMDDSFPVAIFNNSKELHHYKVVWGVAFIRLYIDKKLVDERDYNSGSSFFLNYLIFHTAPVGGAAQTTRLYNVVFGAQCSNESDYKEGVLDIVPGGTLEQEGATGHLITRNEGTFFLNNSKDTWNWEKSHHWKTLTLDDSGEPVLDNPRVVQNNLIEYGKDGTDYYTMLHNPVNRDYQLHTGEQVGSKNTDLETYGKFFSLFTNNFKSDFLQTTMRLFDAFTFTNGYTDDFFDFSVLGISGSIARLLSVYAIQFSQIADTKRNVLKSSLVENKTGFNLDLYFTRFGLSMPIDLPDDKLLLLSGFLSKFQYPTRDVLIEAISIGLGIPEDLVEINEKGSEAEIEIVKLSPRSDGIFSSIGWDQYFEDFINRVKVAGVTYTFIFKLFGVSSGVSGSSVVQAGP
jgi:hypothetical protein